MYAINQNKTGSAGCEKCLVFLFRDNTVTTMVIIVLSTFSINGFGPYPLQSFSGQ